MNLRLALVLLVTGVAQGQITKPLPTLPIQPICDQLTALVDKYNAAHPGTNADAMCSVAFPMYPEGTHEVHYPLSHDEIDHLNDLRIRSDAAFTEEAAYKKELLRRHGHPEPSFSDSNWHYVGIQEGKDYITEDVPNKKAKP